MFAKKMFALIDVTDFEETLRRAAACEAEGADGVLFAGAGGELVSVVRRAAELLEIPIAAECENLCEAEELLRAGASKIVLGDAAVCNPSLISKAAETFESKRVVVAVRAQRKGDGYWEVCTDCGACAKCMDAYCFAVAAARLGAGELLLVSHKRGGRLVPCDADFAKLVAPEVRVPVALVCTTNESRELSSLMTASAPVSVVSPTLFCVDDALSLKRSISAAKYGAYGEAALEFRLGA